MRLLKLREIQREKARNNFEEFVRYVAPEITLKWFHLLLCQYIDKLYRREIKKLMCFLPTQHGKSTISSMLFPAYALGRSPSTRIATWCFGQSLSSYLNLGCQRIMRTELYKDLFPDSRLNEPGSGGTNEALNNTYFEILKYYGSYTATSIGSSITGKPVDISIMDDMYASIQAARSKAVRDEAWDTFVNVFKKRLHNDSIQLMLMTRANEDDIPGRILNKEGEFYHEAEAAGWNIIAIPALKEQTKPIPEAIDIDDPREIDEALWEERHGKEKFIFNRKVNPVAFSAIDQQRPTAEQGNIIKKEWLPIVDINELPFNPDGIHCDFLVDGAFTEKTENDPTAIMAAYHHKLNGKIYIFNCVPVRYNMNELLAYLLKFARQNYYKRQSKVLVEPKASGHTIIQLLRRIEYGTMNAIAINNDFVKLGKFNRVQNILPFLASDKVVLVRGGWNNEFIAECASFPASHDDMVDLLAYAVHEYLITDNTPKVTYL